MRFPFLSLLSLVLSLAGCTDAEAGVLRRRAASPAPASSAGTCTAYTAPVAAVPAAGVPDSPHGFLTLLNAERARHGRRPLAWDASLAACAARNAGVHAPGSSGGAMQCWAGTSSYTHALRMWMASPAHRNILMAAQSSVGASTCPSGVTCNAR